MTKKAFRVSGILYLLMWGLYLAGLAVCHFTGLEYRPFMWVGFCTVAFYYPALTFCVFIWRKTMKKWVRAVFVITYGIFLFVSSLILLLSLLLSLPEIDKMDCGYLEVKQAEFLGPTEYSYAYPRFLFFMQPFEWGTQHDIRLLESTYDTTFTLGAPGKEGRPRYIPKEHPEIQVTIYDRNLDGSIDDYGYQLTSNIALRCYRGANMSWTYDWDKSYVGDLHFLIEKPEEFEQFSKDMAYIISEAVKDPFYKEHVGWISVKVGDDMERALYFGKYLPFREKGLPPDYFAASRHVLAKLKEWYGQPL